LTPSSASARSLTGATPTTMTPKTAAAIFKEPPSPATMTVKRKRPKQKVLDEDAFVSKVSSIIERDFFPELEKLDAQREYIEASERNDVAAMNRLRERFSTARAGHQGRAGSPETFETPLEESRQKEEAEVNPTPSTSSVAGSVSGEEPSKGPSLDSFLAKHTSEDNESFNEIAEESRQKFRFEHSWMFKDDEQKSIEDKSKQLVLPSIEDQANQDRKELKGSRAVDGWTYQNVNAVFYQPEGADLSAQELIERAKKERKICHENTRFSKNPWKTQLQASNLKETVHNKLEKDAGKVGVDGKTFVRPETPAVGGFKFLRMTPSPMPGAAAESPLMTWGEVEGTPYRLEGAETPVPVNASGGPSFSIQAMPKRDRIAHELAEKNSRFYRDKKGKAKAVARGNIRTPKLNLTDRVATMSPAAQRLATTKLGIRLGTDKALRASYTPSPARTPSRATPSRRDAISSSIRSKSGSQTPRTPSISATSATAGDITDDLLKLPKSIEEEKSASSKAADFL